MTLTNQQKLLVVVLLLVLSLLAWQVYITFDLGTEPSRGTTHFRSQVAKPTAVNQGYLHAENLPISQTPATVSQRVELKPLSKRQVKYLDLVNEYKITEMKRRIADDNAAIAKAAEATTRAEIATKTMLAKAGFAGDALTATDEQRPLADNDKRYQLIYTGKQDGLWSATINDHGHLVDVAVGSELSDDVKVVDVTRDTVVIARGKSKRVLSFLDTPKAASPTNRHRQSARTRLVRKQTKKPLTHTAKKAQTTTLLAAHKKAAQKLTEQKTLVHKTVQISKQVVKSKPTTTADASLAATIAAQHQQLAAFHKPQQKQHKTAARRKSDVKRTVQKQRQSTVAVKTKPQAKPVSVKVKPTVAIAKVPQPKLTQTQSVAQTKSRSDTTTRAQSTTEKTVVAKAPPMQQNASTSSRTYNAQERELLQANASTVTIQLLANTQLKEIDKFIHQNHLQGKVSFYRTSLQGLPIYVVVYRQYPSEDAALQAIATLPIGLQRYSPFAKSMREVQEELHRVV
jgi:septal ring-binding cell division protein DamX